MPELFRGERNLGEVRVTRRLPATAEHQGSVTFETQFLVLPGEYALRDSSGRSESLVVTLVIPSTEQVRVEAQLVDAAHEGGSQPA